VARQTVGAGYFSATSLSVNKEDVTALNYASLDELEKYRLTQGANKGSFRFRLSWPHTTPNEWIQTSNPVTSTTVTGFIDSSLNHKENNWGGLRKGSGQSVLKGSTNDLWFYAVGSFGVWSGGIPSNQAAAQVVEFWVWDDTGAALPDYTAGPITSSGRYYLVAKQTIPNFFTANQLTLDIPFNYANLNNLERFRSNGKFQFLLIWPGQSNQERQEWVQTSNPVQVQNVTGYASVGSVHSDYNWGGLHKDNAYALISGCTVFPGCWWYAVGSFQNFQGGIPAFNAAVQVVQLYALAPNGPPSGYY
jgi:hypothetical protein